MTTKNDTKPSIDHIRIGKFEDTGFREDDREAPLLVNGEMRGTVVAVKGNFGGRLTPEWKVAEYDVTLWAEDCESERTRTVKVRSRRGEVLIPPHVAKKVCRRWVARMLEAEAAK